MLILLTLIATYFIWAYIHEYSHLLMLRRYRKVTDYALRLYPHKNADLGFVFAAVSTSYDPPLKIREKGCVAIAPRFADLIAVLILMFADINNPYLLILLSGGAIDLMRGSFSYSSESDIARYCVAFNLDEDLVSVFQVSLAITAIILAA